MRIRVFDTETTGLPEKEAVNDHEVIEIAFTDVVSVGDKWTQDYRLDQLLQPTKRLDRASWVNMDVIDLEALATHHITLHMLQGMPPSSRVNDYLHQPAPWDLLNKIEEADIFAAHNIAFDSQFVDFKGKPVICTYKCAKWAWQDAPRHTNQVLRYYLGLDLLSVKCEPAHRAGPDTYVTSAILIELLKLYSIEQLIEWTKIPTLMTKFTFGKFFGEPLDSPKVDIGYLNWILGQDFDEDTKYYVKRERDRRVAESHRIAEEARALREKQRLEREAAAAEEQKKLFDPTNNDPNMRLVPRPEN